LRAQALPGGTRPTTRLDDIFEDRSVHAVLVLTPPHTHLEMVQRAARAGKHVLVEKPLDIDLRRARSLVEACDAAGVRLAVMLQQRLRPGALRLAELMGSGALGSLIGASASVRWWRPQSYYDAVPGRGTLGHDGGGVLMTQAIHTLDLLLSVTGLPVRISGTVHTSALHRMECEDTAAALLHYADGATAVVRATTAACPGYAECIEIDGTRGTATLASGELKVQLASGELIQAGTPAASGGGADPMAFDHAPHRAVLHDFVHSVRDGRRPAVDGRSALEVQRVIEAIVASSNQGRSIALDPSSC
jgi:predicted dehydrogenase